MTSNSYVHGPAAVWSCLSCHDPEGKPKYASNMHDREVCFQCHMTKKTEWNSKKKVHGPVNMGVCSLCHNPHSAKYPFVLRKSPWRLCVTCHADRGSGAHVTSGFISGNPHPTRGRPDPVRQGKELSCTSCHDPHASDSGDLFKYGITDRSILCAVCHQ